MTRLVNGRQKLLVGVVCLFAVSLLTYVHVGDLYIAPAINSKDNSSTPEKPHSKQGNTRIHKDNSVVKDVKKINVIKDTCRNASFLATNEYHGEDIQVYYLSKQYKFTYCKVPKSGSTFWTQTFSVLESGESLFNQKRVRVHNIASKFIRPFKSVASLPAVIVSRDPFSRLYSAYIDKVYLKLITGISELIRRKSNGKMASTCVLDVSFEEFLVYIIRSVQSGHTLNPHWAPIYSLCKPCDANTKYHLKQESFDNDVEYVLKDIGVKEKKRNVILSALHEHRIEYTIPGIIETVFEKTSRIRNCFTSKILVKRLWKSFLIQGYARDNIDIRNRITDETKYNNVKYISKLFLKTINENKLSSIESKRQRLKALVHAYRGVRTEVIKAISSIYKIDIEMFGYNKYPPKTF